MMVKYENQDMVFHGSAQGELSHEVDPCQVSKKAVVGHHFKRWVVMVG